MHHTNHVLELVGPAPAMMVPEDTQEVVVAAAAWESEAKLYQKASVQHVCDAIRRPRRVLMEQQCTVSQASQKHREACTAELILVTDRHAKLGCMHPAAPSQIPSMPGGRRIRDNPQPKSKSKTCSPVEVLWLLQHRHVCLCIWNVLRDVTHRQDAACSHTHAEHSARHSTKRTPSAKPLLNHGSAAYSTSRSS